MLIGWQSALKPYCASATKKTKYIVYIDGDDVEKMVIFSGWEKHASRATNMEVISAGSIEIGDDISCYGCSGTLEVESRKQDADIARFVLGRHD